MTFPPTLYRLRRAAAALGVLSLAVVLAACNHAPPAALLDPVSAADSFFATLESGSARAAYDSAAFGFQASQSYDAFLSNARQLGIIGAQPPGWTGKDIRPSEARLDGSVVTQTGTIGISVTMTPDGNVWRLFSLRTAAGVADTENRFSQVGKGVGINDVYHQPVPTNEQLAALIHDTMARFNDAVKRGDFHDFYDSVSEEWKRGIVPPRLVSPGQHADLAPFQELNPDTRVTPNLLQNHFQPFIDKKIDISAVADLPPYLNTPPLIDQDGFLNLNGYFDTPQFRVLFSLQYAYELPHWKLYGINVGIEKLDK